MTQLDTVTAAEMFGRGGSSFSFGEDDGHRSVISVLQSIIV